MSIAEEKKSSVCIYKKKKHQSSVYYAFLSKFNNNHASSVALFKKFKANHIVYILNVSCILNELQQQKLRMHMCLK